MANKDLLKIQREKADISKKLDDYTANGIMVEQADEFNNLCRQEFVLKAKERMLNYKPGDKLDYLSQRITRTVTFKPIQTLNKI